MYMFTLLKPKLPKDHWEQICILTNLFLIQEIRADIPEEPQDALDSEKEEALVCGLVPTEAMWGGLGSWDEFWTSSWLAEKWDVLGMGNNKDMGWLARGCLPMEGCNKTKLGTTLEKITVTERGLSRAFSICCLTGKPFPGKLAWLGSECFALFLPSRSRLHVYTCNSYIYALLIYKYIYIYIF